MTPATAAVDDRVSLYLKEGSSDKEYHAGIEPSGAGGGFVVNFAYGRRGSTLQTGTKTVCPVSREKAQGIFDKLVREKMAKGYTSGSDGMPYQHTEKEDRATGILPQLLNSISETEANILMKDPFWWVQEKFDGKRVLIRKSGRQITGINRKGLSIALPQSIVERARIIGGNNGQWLIDGEAVGEAFIAFDMLEQGNVDLRQQPYNRRLQGLYAIVTPNGTHAIRAADTAIGNVHKQSLFASLRHGNREGVVFKRHDAPYTPGRPSSGGDQFKLKFTATASCIVTGTNGTKRSVALELIDGTRKVGVGSVTIPVNHLLPLAGSVVDVKYLYAFPGGSLFQPVYLGVRDDLDADACTIGQLKFKPYEEH